MTATLSIRIASISDLARIVELLGADDISASRPGATDVVTPSLQRAFKAIDSDPNNELVVATFEDEVIGTMQLSYIAGLSRGGAKRLLIEAVHVDGSLRGEGIGRAMIEWAHQRGRDNGCSFAQLTSDKRRSDAHRFYRSLGYEQSHEGFKLQL